MTGAKKVDGKWISARDVRNLNIKKFKTLDDKYSESVSKPNEFYDGNELKEGYSVKINNNGTKTITSKPVSYKKYYERDYDSDRKNEVIDTYIPREVILDKNNNIIKDIRRSDYKYDYTSDDNYREAKREVYDKEVSHFSNGTLVNKKVYEPFVAKAKNYSSGKNVYERGVYLKENLDYVNSKGTSFKAPTKQRSYLGKIDGVYKTFDSKNKYEYIKKQREDIDKKLLELDNITINKDINKSFNPKAETSKLYLGEKPKTDKTALDKYLEKQEKFYNSINMPFDINQETQKFFEKQYDKIQKGEFDTSKFVITPPTSETIKPFISTKTEGTKQKVDPLNKLLNTELPVWKKIDDWLNDVEIKTIKSNINKKINDIETNFNNMSQEKFNNMSNIKQAEYNTKIKELTDLQDSYKKKEQNIFKASVSGLYDQAKYYGAKTGQYIIPSNIKEGLETSAKAIALYIGLPYALNTYSVLKNTPYISTVISAGEKLIYGKNVKDTVQGFAERDWSKLAPALTFTAIQTPSIVKDLRKAGLLKGKLVSSGKGLKGFEKEKRDLEKAYQTLMNEKRNIGKLRLDRVREIENNPKAHRIIKEFAIKHKLTVGGTTGIETLKTTNGQIKLTRAPRDLELFGNPRWANKFARDLATQLKNAGFSVKVSKNSVVFNKLGGHGVNFQGYSGLNLGRYTGKIYLTEDGVMVADPIGIAYNKVYDLLKSTSLKSKQAISLSKNMPQLYEKGIYNDKLLARYPKDSTGALDTAKQYLRTQINAYKNNQLPLYQETKLIKMIKANEQLKPYYSKIAEIEAKAIPYYSDDVVKLKNVLQNKDFRSNTLFQLKNLLKSKKGMINLQTEQDISEFLGQDYVDYKNYIYDLKNNPPNIPITGIYSTNDYQTYSPEKSYKYDLPTSDYYPKTPSTYYPKPITPNYYPPTTKIDYPSSTYYPDPETPTYYYPPTTKIDDPYIPTPNEITEDKDLWLKYKLDMEKKKGKKMSRKYRTKLRRLQDPYYRILNKPKYNFDLNKLLKERYGNIYT